MASSISWIIILIFNASLTSSANDIVATELDWFMAIARALPRNLNWVTIAGNEFFEWLNNPVGYSGLPVNFAEITMTMAA